MKSVKTCRFLQYFVIAIFLTKDQMFYERTKHIDVRNHFVRDVISHDDIVVNSVDIKDNPADIMTITSGY